MLSQPFGSSSISTAWSWVVKEGGASIITQLRLGPCKASHRDGTVAISPSSYLPHELQKDEVCHVTVCRLALYFDGLLTHLERAAALPRPGSTRRNKMLAAQLMETVYCDIY
jgi:hypothetical protein